VVRAYRSVPPFFGDPAAEEEEDPVLLEAAGFPPDAEQAASTEPKAASPTPPALALRSPRRLMKTGSAMKYAPHSRHQVKLPPAPLASQQPIFVTLITLCQDL
jgi:hypothetical protein